MRWKAVVGCGLVFSSLCVALAADEPLPPNVVARLGNGLLRPANGQVSSSRDGQRIICSVSVFDATTGKRLGDPPHAGTIAYADDGQWLAVSNLASGDARVEIWDARRNQIVETLANVAANELAFSSDGRLLFARLERGGVRVWKFLPGRSRVLAESPAQSVMSRDGRWLGDWSKSWFANWSKSEVTVRQLADQQVAWRKLVQPAVSAAVFAPDGQRLFVADFEGGMQALNASTGERIAAFTIPKPLAQPEESANPQATTISVPRTANSSSPATNDNSEFGIRKRGNSLAACRSRARRNRWPSRQPGRGSHIAATPRFASWMPRPVKSRSRRLVRPASLASRSPRTTN